MSILRSLHRRFPHPTQEHWWRIPFIAKGGFGAHGFWVKALGVKLSVNDSSWYGYAVETRLSFFGLFAIDHADTRGSMLKSTGPTWVFDHIKFNFKAVIRWAR